ncbi:hypothetical protein SAMN05660649_03440 [Desulfotomaculum arcticum]|uniref:Uncharacterized protein n=1 Tax=Desulfotruncus arcticus DSM 17038 TaxID=1121424 RepID=A0A1I2WIC1_9FIRM|nr:hypothetical protein [Desulfotruncus arcticus]SFG99361.1 hypothetical protein SAMN05660649_03440 [Desulfotomaculum arcticum] [Desulfotruncus arcticus DSM 17038]
MAVEDQEKMEKTLIKLLEYQKEHNINSQDLMTMMSLISLMSMIDVLNRDKPAGAANPDANNLQAMLGPLLGLLASGMGSAGGGEAGKQPPFNPAMLFNLLSAFGGGQPKGGQPKGGQPDLSGLMWLLAPLFGGQGGAFKQGPAQSDTTAPNGPSQPVQREINLDLKEKKTKENKPQESNPPTEIIKSIREDERKEKLPKPGEVLEWKFGVS